MVLKWTARLMSLLLGPTLEDVEEARKHLHEEKKDLTNEEIENIIEEADIYGTYTDYFDTKRQGGSDESSSEAERSTE
tara:strand:- start:5439 stop:5672 length:234 start_codon:yes stop_codon:yes gene_type:complete